VEDRHDRIRTRGGVRAACLQGAHMQTSSSPGPSTTSCSAAAPTSHAPPTPPHVLGAEYARRSSPPRGDESRGPPRVFRFCAQPSPYDRDGGW
jgi:hypothetical protein